MENGIEIKKVLVQKKIHISKPRTNALTDILEESIGYKYAANNLNLLCDQRCRVEGMKCLVEELIEKIYKMRVLYEGGILMINRWPNDNEKWIISDTIIIYRKGISPNAVQLSLECWKAIPVR